MPQTQAHSSTRPLFVPPVPVPLAEFVSRDVPRKKWAVEGFWPQGASGVIAAPPKNGKSTLTVELAVSLATGTPLFGLEDFPCRELARVSYIHKGENSEARIRKDFDLILQARGLGYMEDVLAMPPRTVNADREAGGFPPLPGPEGEQLVIEGEQFRPAWTRRGQEEDGTWAWTPDLDVIVNPNLVLGAQSGMVLQTVLDHRKWFKKYAEGRDYLILDPIYMLAPFSTNDEAAVIDLLGFLSEVRNESECAVIFSHQSTIKAREGGNDAAKILGSTHIPGWYEAAVFPKRKASGLFTFHVDSLREFGVTQDVTLFGNGVGRWYLPPTAQNVTDETGRSSPNKASKHANIDRMRRLLEEDPTLTNEQLAESLDVTPRTIRSYRLEAVETSGNAA
jgi:hypothetical protein